MAIKLVGIELEGGWMNRPNGYRPDSSVTLDAYAEGGEYLIRGETASKPLPVSHVENWIRAESVIAILRVRTRPPLSAPSCPSRPMAEATEPTGRDGMNTPATCQWPGCSRRIRAL